MHSLLPIIPISDLQRSAKIALQNVEDYAVIRSHNRDVAFILTPALGKILQESGMLEELRKRSKKKRPEQDLGTLIGSVLRELSKK
ncbi:hypothetical protein A2881_05830 [Candidatus Peribacteria bacterium RIFCSPHIGHO2_01_FULL_55_13]|nr:MAG: hypothetical protein A2881_05830 [Candidatus Peribacteria bacterium RIFCSPHIGHO2_01_FULL_55_13]OGJ64325.1 MAG: hypothetical protein A3F36_03745 [Candidatus Peribacteria bacterium RIFCSPHIGHO2_12_FULL_55_11]